MVMANTNAVALAVGFIFLNLAGVLGYGTGLQYGFYNGKCKTSDVEAIVRNTVISMFLRDRTIAPALIRMQFHDCFVNCPNRKKGSVSLAQNTRTLPAPSISVSSAIQDFANKGLTAIDMIYLLGNASHFYLKCHKFSSLVIARGGHSIGVAHCSLFKDRLYNFKNTGKPDPTMDLGLLTWLRLTCAKNATVDRTSNLDQNPFSSAVVDKSFYSQIMLHRGVLQIDQELALDSLSKSTVEAIAHSFDFTTKFGQAIVKMGAIQVLTGTQGEIRKSCRAFLKGGHSIGVAHCSLFKDRLYNFKNTGKPDPTMELGLLTWLRLTCAKNATVDRTANLYQNPFSSAVVDKSFYSQIMLHRGVLQIDQELALDSLSKSTVEAIAHSFDFTTKFGQAMVKMGAIQVLTGTQGEIRKSCRAFLKGGHSIGFAHCSLFKDRLYNFKNTGKPDPTMDLGLLTWLRLTCAKNATVDRTANLDQNPFSSAVVDKSFYSQIMLHRGVLQIDQELALDSLSKSTVEAIAHSFDFTTKFGQAMVKMGAIQVLTGTQGEIRKSCRAVNLLTLTSLIN
ncbi:hypothetical protein L1987_81806 [Smallanthus sonchifolius]|uniref:Uncharacterized protein n=1 Tax=Smallanthus sonchifolius TaxID=185202 RepID=A0ACB8YSJ5_9ASTR|nr:hypothetical protein L1987_81806 [Smallanthus sonchifolius]